jgi:hypothetical protein
MFEPDKVTRDGSLQRTKHRRTDLAGKATKALIRREKMWVIARPELYLAGRLTRSRIRDPRDGDGSCSYGYRPART